MTTAGSLQAYGALHENVGLRSRVASSSARKSFGSASREVALHNLHDRCWYATAMLRTQFAKITRDGAPLARNPALLEPNRVMGYRSLRLLEALMKGCGGLRELAL